MTRGARIVGRAGVVLAAAALLAVRGDARVDVPRADREAVTEPAVRAHMEMLAGDAMNGRESGSRDEWVAATYVASQLRHWGLEPLGDAGGFVRTIELESGRTWNVMAILRGRDPRRASEVVMLSAHLDNLGVHGTREDRIYNGADDDASGVTGVLEIAHALAARRRAPRSVLFVWFGSEERGGLGVKDFIAHPPVPLTSIVASLGLEMIGRPNPDSPPRTVWLTGYERTTLGPALAAHGARLVADPYPSQRFFERSDNLSLARRGVIAQTISTFGLQPEYHSPSDDLAHIDFAHLTATIQSLIAPIEWLSHSSFTPAWQEGQRPEVDSRESSK
jgi:hypothetical protein